MQPVVKEAPLIYAGGLNEIELPSGRKVTIRETNGDDDEILSNLSASNSQGQQVLNFLANIVESDAGKKPLVKDIEQWPVSDKYYLLFKQRLINHGLILEFIHKCSNPTCPSIKRADTKKGIEYEYDLQEFDEFIKYPSREATEVEFTTSSGKTLKYKILTSKLERDALDLPPDQNHKNTKLTIRQLELKAEAGAWLLQRNFKAYSSKEMSEIRANIDKNDPLFDPIVSFNCVECSMPYQVPLLGMANFYWPGETI